MLFDVLYGIEVRHNRVFLLADCMHEVPTSDAINKRCRQINKALEEYAHALQREFVRRRKIAWNEEAVRQRRADDAARLYGVMCAAALG